MKIQIKPVILNNTRVQVQVFIPHHNQKINDLIMHLYSSTEVIHEIDVILSDQDEAALNHHLDLCHSFAKKLQSIHSAGLAIVPGLIFTHALRLGLNIDVRLDACKYDEHTPSNILVMKVLMTEIQM